MNIIITAGGTSEYIDTVRKITNSGTGKLGAIISNTLLNEHPGIEKLYYVCSKKAIKPEENSKVKIIEISGTMDLKTEVETLLVNEKIDYFIHSMAVSDYIVDYVTTAELLSEEIAHYGNNEETIINNKNVLDNKTKISSYEDNLIIKLKKAPKIIGIIKKLSPTTKLIGFKLLNDVSKEELINVAKKLMDRNNCNYVVANDLKDIKEGNHKAYILDNKNNIITAYSKNDIAKNLSAIII
jgi:phosphopantothenate-cysteine ligase